MSARGRTGQQPAMHVLGLQDVQPQPEILVGKEGAVEVARHPDAESVVTGIVGCAGGSGMHGFLT